MLAEIIHPIAAMNYDEWPYHPRPSNSGPDHCLRKLAFHAADVKGRDPGGRFLVVLDDSSWHEELVVNWIEQSVFHVHSRQLRITCGRTIWNEQAFEITGAIDGIVTDLLSVDRLLECKAIEHFTFMRYVSGETLPTNYFSQCVLYLAGVQALNPEIDECLLLIKNKNQSAFLEYRLRYDRTTDRLTLLEMTTSSGERSFPNLEFIGLYSQAMARFEQIEAHRANGTLPERPYADPENYHCGYCPYRTFCWEGYVRPPLEDTISLREDLVPLVQEYLSLEQEVKPKEKRLKELKQLFKLELNTLHAQTAAGHGYVLNMTESSQDRLDESLLPTALVQRSRVPVPVQKLTVYRAHETRQTLKRRLKTPLAS